MQKSQFWLTKTRRFLPLFLTQFGGAFNDNLFKTGLGMLITFKLVADANHAQLLINLSAGLFILPFLLFSGLAGQLSDKFLRNHLIRIIKLLEIAFMVVVAIGFYFESIPILMAVVFLMGMHSTFFGPIKYSALPDLLDPSELLAGNGLIEGSTFIAILMGTLLGSALGASREEAFILSGVAIIVAIAGWVSSLFIPKIALGNANLKISYNFFSEIKSLLIETARVPGLFLIICLLSWFWFIGLIFVTQFPIYGKEIVGGTKYVVTLFLLLFTVGIALGCLLCDRFLKGKVTAQYVPIGMLGMSLFILDLGWASHSLGPTSTGARDVFHFLASFTGVRISLDLFLMSVFGGFYTVPLYAMLQTKSVAQSRSRVIACNNILNALFMVVAAAFAMAFSALKFSPVELFLVVGMMNAVVTAIVWKKCRTL